MTNTIFIMCAGVASRFDGELKQLLPIGNTTILGRQLTQLKDEEDVHIVSHNPAVIDYAKDHDCGYIVPEKHGNVCQSILSTRHRWGDYVTVLLGDVIYSNRTLETILTQRHPIMFYGDEYEVYAASFSDHAIGLNAFEMGSDTSYGRVRYAYRRLIGVPWDRGDTKKGLIADPIFHYIDCWVTRDIDTQGEYDDAKKHLVNRGILDKE